MIKDLMTLFRGRKTYFVAALFGALAFANASGWVTKEQMDAVSTALFGAGFAALRAGVGNK